MPEETFNVPCNALFESVFLGSDFDLVMATLLPDADFLLLEICEADPFLQSILDLVDLIEDFESIFFGLVFDLTADTLLSEADFFGLVFDLTADALLSGADFFGLLE